jgi:hypothetical protein
MVVPIKLTTFVYVYTMMLSVYCVASVATEDSSNEVLSFLFGKYCTIKLLNSKTI